MAGHDWLDATTLLADGCAAISKGDIVISPTIPLWDAMGAIKIGDARMDMGAELPIPAGEQASTAKLAFDPTRLLLPAEVIEIIDRTLACEMTWHTGHSLSQTVYTSLYLHELAILERLHPPPSSFFRRTPAVSDDPARPPEITALVLRAYLLGTAKSVEAAWEEIVKGNLYENEDINTSKAGLSLYEDVTMDEALALLDEAHDWLDAWDEEGTAGMRVALMERLRFRIEYLYSLSLFWSGPESLRSLDDHATSAVSALLTCFRLGSSLSPDSLAIVESAFDNTIARRLPTDMPPRPMKMFTNEEGAKFAIRMVEDLTKVIEMAQVSGIVEWQLFFESFSRRGDDVAPFVRSLLTSCFFSHDVVALDTNRERNLAWLGRQYLREFIGLDGDLMPLAPSLLQHVNLLAGNLVAYFNVLNHNRARARRKLAALIPQWRNFHSTAVLLSASGDAGLQRLPLGPTFIMLSISIEILLAGFDLDLYGHAERRVMRWAACRLLATKRDMALATARQTLSPTFLDVAHLDAAVLFLLSAALDLALVDEPKLQTSLDVARANYDRRLKFLKVDASDSLYRLPECPSLSFDDFLAWETEKTGLSRQQLASSCSDNLASARQALQAVMGREDRDVGPFDTQIRSTTQALVFVFTRLQQRSSQSDQPSEAMQPNDQQRILKWFQVG